MDTRDGATPLGLWWGGGKGMQSVGYATVGIPWASPDGRGTILEGSREVSQAVLPMSHSDFFL